MHSSIDPRIFRAYDIRGRAHEQITVEACRLIGQAFGTELFERTGNDAPTVCVGRDARTHSPDFETAVIEGLLEAGCTVIRIGQTPSPVNYFAVCHEGFDAGIQVTASHNPAHDNGLKFCVKDAQAFAGHDLQKLRERIERGALRNAEGTLESLEASEHYAEHLRTLFEDAGQDLKIVVDGGNGVAGPLNCAILRAIGAEVVELYTEPDGTFPNHPADPSKYETLAELQSLVRVEHAQIGLAFDGDGDRLGIVDEAGKIRTADEILLLLAKDHLERFPGSPIVFTVSNSGILQSEITRYGGKPILSRVGHSFVEHAMEEHHAQVGGEQSGHFFCAEDYYGFDDALVAALRILLILQNSGKTLSELCRDFPPVFQSPERRPYVADEHKASVIERAKVHFGKTYPVNDLDGARIELPDGSWIGIRQSNTSPAISICIEARSEKQLGELEAWVLEHLRTYPEIDWGK